MTEMRRPSKAGEERESLSESVRRRANLKLRSEARGKRPLWFGLGMFGLIGWSVVVPTLIGVALGAWLDRRFPSRVSWTLSLLIVGVVIGCFNAWYWVKQESRRA